jgi:NADH-quinone oxidoreductase subunit L
MLCASLAIAGFPFTSGFYSKDAILLAAGHRAPWLYWVGVFTAGMTAFYVFRAFFMTFFGKYRGKEHPHESPPVMIIPLVILAVLSIFGGLLFKIPDFLHTVFPAVEAPEEFAPMVIASAASLLGIGLAALMYWYNPALPDLVVSHAKGLYTLVYNKYFVDEIYDAAIVKPLVGGSRLVLWKGFDAGLIDGIVNGVGARAKNLGGLLRLAQSGNTRSYATWVAFGGVLLIFFMALFGGVR